MRTAALLLALIPPIYIFVAIQYGALTVPYWDHVELARLIETHKTGGFSVEQLWAPHNHSRPLLYRLIYLPNALMTGWDIRSEYAYMYAAIYAGFITHAWILYQNRRRTIDLGFCFGLSLVSLVYFSPVGHMNHWWSMMLQLQLGNVFILVAIWMVANRPDDWKANMLAALGCWLATYTITNGIFAFAICLGVVFLSCAVLSGWKRVLFWLANIVLMLALYLPGLPAEQESSLAVPSFLGFIAVYLGLPLGGLLKFEFVGPFTHPMSITLNAVCGVLLSLLSLFVLYRRRSEVKGVPAAYRFLLACVGFAILSALVTAEGRSGGGAVYANSSRYAIYSSYLLLGLLHYYAWTIGRKGSALLQESNAAREDMRTLGIGLSLVVLAGFTLHAYWKGMAVYRGAHAFDAQLVAVYNNPQATDQEVGMTYPDVTYARHLREMLSKYSLGPYRFQTEKSVNLAGAAPFSDAIRLENSTLLRQRFKATDNELKAVKVQFVTWQTNAPNATLKWTFSRVADGRGTLIGSGGIHTGAIPDWGYVRLELPPVGDSEGNEYELTLQAPPAPLGSQLIGVPIFKPGAGNSWSLETAVGQPVVIAGSMGIRVIYGN